MSEAEGQATATGRNPCAARRADGQPCRAQALGSGFCWAHDRSLAEKRQSARQAGGKHSAKIVRLRGLMPPRLLPVFDLLYQALVDVEAGKLDPKIAQAMASLARAAVACVQAGEVEERIRRLEERLA